MDDMKTNNDDSVDFDIIYDSRMLINHFPPDYDWFNLKQLVLIDKYVQ